MGAYQTSFSLFIRSSLSVMVNPCIHSLDCVCVYMMLQRGSAWPDFKGTWDLPARIPAHRINPTSRSVEGLNRLKSWGFDPQHTGKSQPHRGSKSTDMLQDGDQQVSQKPVWSRQHTQTCMFGVHYSP